MGFLTTAFDVGFVFTLCGVVNILLGDLVLTASVDGVLFDCVLWVDFIEVFV